MPDEAPQPDAQAEAADATDAPSVDPVVRVRRDWREFWQVPTLLVAAGVLMMGVAFAVATAPDPVFDPALTRAERLIEREDYQDAIALLNTEVHPWTAEPGALTQLDLQRFHAAKARAIYWGQKKLEISDDRNHVSIVREYLEAERQGLVLTERDVAALADTHLSRGELDQALRRLATLPPGSHATSEPVVRRAVALLLRPPSPDRARALGLLADVLSDRDVSIDQRIWAVETQSNIRLDQGYADETISRLLREIPRLTQAGAPGRARLHLILARAYRELGADREAMTQVDMAGALSTENDPHFPQILLERARLLARAGDIAGARDTYAQIASKHANSAAYPWAMVGLGETEAIAGSPELSIEAYAKLIGEYDALGAQEPTREQILASTLERSRDALSVENPRLALQYAALGERVMRGRELPATLLETVAVAHERAADELVAGATTGRSPLLGLDPSTRVEVQRHLVAAATNRRLHADRFVLSDLNRFASSLWTAANLFDRAGDQREAIQAFKTFAEVMPGDPRYAEAKFRMAEALRAMGEFGPASQVYKDLIAEREGSAGVDIGAWADASFVPLAQAYLYDEDATNDAEAERLLSRAIDGSIAGTQTELFRDALVELAFLRERAGEHARAIERLEEVAERYTDDREIGLVLYRLGEAHRKLAHQINRSLEESLPPTTRAERRAKVETHRRAAIDRYARAMEVISAKRDTDRTRLEDLSLRNAHFYTGDLLGDLGEYDNAIRAYDLARDRYADQPATLVALVQIVNLHVAQGDMRRARTANERARRFYLSLPDETWEDPTLPMERADWQAWLDASTRLLATANAGAGAADGG